MFQSQVSFKMISVQEAMRQASLDQPQPQEDKFRRLSFSSAESRSASPHRQNIFNKMDKQESEYLSKQPDFCPRFDKQGEVIGYSVVGPPALFSDLKEAQQKRLGVWQDKNPPSPQKQPFRLQKGRVMSARQKKQGQAEDRFQAISNQELEKQMKKQLGKTNLSKVNSQLRFQHMPNQFEVIRLTQDQRREANYQRNLRQWEGQRELIARKLERPLSGMESDVANYLSKRDFQDKIEQKKDPGEKHGQQVWYQGLRNEMRFHKAEHYQEQDKENNEKHVQSKNSHFDKHWERAVDKEPPSRPPSLRSHQHSQHTFSRSKACTPQHSSQNLSEGQLDLQRIPYKTFSSKKLFQDKLKSINLQNFAPSLAIEGQNKICMELQHLKSQGQYKILKQTVKSPQQQDVLVNYDKSKAHLKNTLSFLQGLKCFCISNIKQK